MSDFGLLGGNPGSSPFSLGTSIPNESNALNSNAPSLIPNLTLPPPLTGDLSFAVGSASVRNLPWDFRNSNVNSGFFYYIDLDPQRWNQIFPYRLLVVDVSAPIPRIVGGTQTVDVKITGNQVGAPIINVIPSETSLNSSQWVYNLPITPQQLSIVDQYAINTSASLRGILEEHNGVKFKMINISGTFGVWNQRHSIGIPKQATGVEAILQSFFGGTINAVQGLVQQVTQVVNTVTSGHPASKPAAEDPVQSELFTTGYYQALSLQQFLEQYAEAKKDPKNASWRLVLDMPKQNQSYVVTPMQFNWTQSVNRPVNIDFNIQLKAWRRIKLGESTNVPPAQAYTLTPGILQRVLNTITEARLAASSAIALIGAVRSDVDNIFNVMSQTALFVKDLLGIVPAASDLPSSIVKDFNSAIQEFAFNNSSAITSAVTDAASLGAVAAITAATVARNGITQSAASNGQLGNATAALQSTNSTNQIFNNPNAFVGMLDQVPTNQLNLNTAQQNKLNNILSNTSLTVAQIKKNANTILGLTLQLANHFGAGDAYYDKVYNLAPPTSRTQPMSISEYDFLDLLYNFIQSCYTLSATTQVDDLTIQSSLDYVAGLADQSGIAFTVPTCKILVPVPYGLTIEGIAARYLGDPNRWLEIATLNNLKEPYIDENGFQLPLLSNGIGRQVVVSSNTNLYLGQVVTLKSSTQLPTSRHITNITTLANASGYLITLDGDPNLGIYTIADSAYLQAYLPGTTNSQQKIFIPSDLPPPTFAGQVNVIPPGVTSGDPLTGLSGVDWLIDENGDLVTNSFGDFNLAYGLTNIIQWLKIAFSVVLGTWISHPQFGLGVRPGTSVADLNVQDLYNQINALIQQDPRFQGVDGLQIQVAPPVLLISVNIAIAGQNGTFPITFQLGN